jgi:hypothetical protein
MTQENTQDGMRYAPTTSAANELIALVSAYDAAYEKAREANEALAKWALDFVGSDIKVGDIIEVGKEYGNAGHISNFTMRDTFSGWKNNRRRMRIDSISAVTNAPLTHHTRLDIHISGVPLKDDDQPFKGAWCSVTVDIMRQAYSFSFHAESGYSDYHKDALARYIDYKTEKTGDKSKAA